MNILRTLVLLTLTVVLTGCINVQAPEKVNVDADNSDAGYWKSVGKSYADQYRSGSTDPDTREREHNYDD